MQHILRMKNGLSIRFVANYINFVCRNNENWMENTWRFTARADVGCVRLWRGSEYFEI